MSFALVTFYLNECRISLEQGDARGALDIIQNVAPALEEGKADYYRQYKHQARAQAHKDAYAKSKDPEERAFHIKRAAHHDDKSMRRSYPALRKDENAPINWSGAKQDYKSKVGDFFKRAGRKAIGMKGKAHSDAQDAYQHGQAALAHTQKLAKDSENFSKKAGNAAAAADKFASKGKDDRAAALKVKADRNTEKSVAAHNQGVKMHQAAMTGFKRTMDTANKEGDRETADWAAKAGAVHTNNRAWHMQQGSNIRKWASGQAKPDGKASEKTPAAGPTSAQGVDKARAQAFSNDYKDHKAKIAAKGQGQAPTASYAATKPAAPSVSSTVGKAPSGRKPGAAPVRKIKSDTKGATKTGT